ncbi:MAG: hypothetical protein CSA39_07055 [Flavobacteriales bacterium]|nr:MAG: hypothetical protein CSA39_07055 [Flavobacteriales bacterium]
MSTHFNSIKLSNIIIFIFCLTVCLGCVNDDDYDIPPIANCEETEFSVTKTLDEIFNQTTIEVTQYKQPDIIEAYVTSNDQFGNFRQILHLQNATGTRGFSIPIAVNDLYTSFNPGRKVYVRLENTFTQIHFDALKIGNKAIDAVTGQSYLDKIPPTNYKNIIINTCKIIDEDKLVTPLRINEITDAYLNTLIELKDVQFEEAALGKTLYDANTDVGGGTNYLISDISEESIAFRTLFSANFANNLVPDGNGTIRGVLGKFNNTYQLMIRNLSDLQLNNERKRIGFAENITGTKTTIATVRDYFNGNDVKIFDDVYIEGVITLSGIDYGNASERVAFIQDETAGIALRLSSKTSLKQGYKVKVNLKDAVLLNLKGLLYANLVQYKKVAFLEENSPLPTPKIISINDLNSNAFQAQLVQLENVQFEEETGTFKGERILTNCKQNFLLRTEKTASFAKENYPDKNGTITGIASVNKNPVLLIRNLSDVSEMVNERCVPMGDLSEKIFFSELADPDNNSKARFIEIYNAEDKPLDLRNWVIERYTNDSETVSTSIDLTGVTIAPKQAFVIAVDAVEFEKVYGFAPDMDGTSTGPAGSNGDDNMVLKDPNDKIIDIFGVIGKDGSGTNHEFEDGRAYRKALVVKGNPIYTFSEWEIWNDTGGDGTTKKPQNAPADFTPGIR